MKRMRGWVTQSLAGSVEPSVICGSCALRSSVIIVKADRSRAMIDSELDRDVSLSVASRHPSKRIACRVATMHLLHERLARVLGSSRSSKCPLTARPSGASGGEDVCDATGSHLCVS